MPGYYHRNGAYSYKAGFQNTGIEEGVTNFRALNAQGERQKIRFGTWLSAWNPATQSEAWRVELPDLGGNTRNVLQGRNTLSATRAWMRGAESRGTQPASLVTYSNLSSDNDNKHGAIT